MSSQPSSQALQRVKFEPDILDPPAAVDTGPGSPLSPEDSAAIHKVSNSDDEDTTAQACINININKGSARQLSRGPPSAKHQHLSGGTRPVAAYNSALAACPAYISRAKSREDGSLQHRSSYAGGQHEQRTHSSPLEGSSGSIPPRGVHTYAPNDRQAATLSQWPSKLPQGLFPNHLDFATLNAPDRGRMPPRHPAMLSQHMVQPSHQTSSALLSYKEAMRRLQQIPQSALHTGIMPPSTNLAGTQTQSDRLSAVTGVMISSSSVADKENRRPLNMENGSFTGLSEIVEAREYVQILPTSGKHPATSPHMDATKRPKKYSGFRPGCINLQYQTIKVINMPTRGDLLPGQEVPEPTPDNLPYGDTEDYQSSMLIYWLDEQELSYRESIELCKQRFPAETSNYDTIRRRHQGSLQRLAKKYGLKPTSEITKPGFKVLRRGLLAGTKYNRIGGKAFEPTKATHVAENLLGETTTAAEQHASTTSLLWIQSQSQSQAQSQSQSQAQANRGSKGHIRSNRLTQPLATRGLLLACIVVWKDTEGASFEQIQKRLADEFKWELSTATIRKVYYAERPRVYDVRRNTGNDAQVDLEAKASALGTSEPGEDTTGEDASFGLAGTKVTPEHFL